MPHRPHCQESEEIATARRVDRHRWSPSLLVSAGGPAPGWRGEQRGKGPQIVSDLTPPRSALCFRRTRQSTGPAPVGSTMLLHRVSGQFLTAPRRLCSWPAGAFVLESSRLLPPRPGSILTQVVPFCRLNLGYFWPSGRSKSLHNARRACLVHERFLLEEVRRPSSAPPKRATSCGKRSLRQAAARGSNQDFWGGCQPRSLSRDLRSSPPSRRRAAGSDSRLNEPKKGDLSCEW